MLNNKTIDERKQRRTFFPMIQHFPISTVLKSQAQGPRIKRFSCCKEKDGSRSLNLKFMASSDFEILFTKVLIAINFAIVSPKIHRSTYLLILKYMLLLLL